jgi:hypothetical protein
MFSQGLSCFTFNKINQLEKVVLEAKLKMEDQLHVALYFEK